MLASTATKRPGSTHCSPAHKWKRLRPICAPRGHYDVLGIRSDASPSAVREAFLREVLTSHPDKGGHPQRFEAVMHAYRILQSTKQRAEYDEELHHRACFDGMPRDHDIESQTDEESVCNDSNYILSKASILLSTLLEKPSSAWKSIMANQCSQTLESLKHLLVYGFPHRFAVSTPHRKPQHITKTKKKYWARVQFANVKLECGYTFSFDQAVSWHVAIEHIIACAKTRLNYVQFPGRWPKLEPEVVPVELSDLHAGLEVDPALQLYMSPATAIKRAKHEGAKQFKTQSLHLAAQLRTALLRGLPSEGVLQEIVRERKSRPSRRQEILVAVVELQLQQHECRHVSHALGHMPQALALADVIRQKPADKLERVQPPAFLPFFQKLPQLKSTRLSLRTCSCEEIMPLTLQHMGLIELGRARRISVSLTTFFVAEFRRRCRCFKYDAYVFQTDRRLRRHDAIRAERRFYEFISVQKFSEFFVELSLLKCPKAFFDADALRSTFHRMCNLICVSLPLYHISSARHYIRTGEEVKQFASLLPKGVTLKCFNRAGDLKVTGEVSSCGVVVKFH